MDELFFSLIRDLNNLNDYLINFEILLTLKFDFSLILLSKRQKRTKH